MSLSKPPVIQTWITFTFASDEEGRKWDLPGATEFLSLYRDSLPVQAVLYQTEFQFQDLSPYQRTEIVKQETQLDSVKAHNQEGTHWLQIAKDRLVCNRTRGKGAYLGYESLRDEALSKLSKYVLFFRPSRLRTAELHYVDLIEIPIPPEGKLDLEQYFDLRVHLPETYGPTWYFSTRLFLSPKIPGITLEVKFESQPPVPNSNTFRFQFDWHIGCSKIGVFDQQVVKERLDKAHDCLKDYFRASVTDKTWELFQPVDGGDDVVRSSGESPSGPA